MINYYLLNKNQGVVRVITNQDGSTNHLMISNDLNDINHQAYLKWLAEGNQPLPADEGIPSA